MSGRKAARPHTPRHIPIFDEDWEFLDKMYGPGSASKLGIGPTIRQVVHIFVTAQRAKEQEAVEATLASQPGAKA